MTALAVERAEGIEQLAWSEFLGVFDWQQDEHVTLLGPTRCGKTTLAREILPRRRYPIVVATKPKDPLIRTFKADGYKVVRRLPLPPSILYQRVVFWPPAEKPGDVAAQRGAIRTLLSDAYERGGFCIYIDELRYVSEYLKLAPFLELIWQQGGSNRISLVGGTQRPAFVPLAAYDQATHLFLWKNTDDRALRRLGDLGGVPSTLLRSALVDLDWHEVLYVNTRTGTLVRTIVEV